MEVDILDKFYVRWKYSNKDLTQWQKYFSDGVISWEPVIVIHVEVQHAALQLVQGEPCQQTGYLYSARSFWQFFHVEGRKYEDGFIICFILFSIISCINGGVKNRFCIKVKLLQLNFYVENQI